MAFTRNCPLGYLYFHCPNRRGISRTVVIPSIESACQGTSPDRPHSRPTLFRTRLTSTTDSNPPRRQPLHLMMRLAGRFGLLWARRPLIVLFVFFFFRELIKQLSENLSAGRERPLYNLCAVTYKFVCKIRGRQRKFMCLKT